MRQCDNKSVGVIITEESGDFLLLERARFPFGLAPPAGHVDEHGTTLDTAVAEVKEELGFQLEASQLTILVKDLDVANVCRRPGGSHHMWTVYAARVRREACVLRPSAAETNGAGWYSPGEIKELADKTALLGRDVEQRDMPALEQVWVGFFDELKLLT